MLAVHYRRFVRGGRCSTRKKRAIARRHEEELAKLAVRYNDNLLSEARLRVLLTSEAELEASYSVRQRPPTPPRSAASRAGFQRWTNLVDSVFAVFQRRDLREKLYKGYITRGDHGDELDNKKIIARIAVLRVQQAKLLGFATFADYVLDEQMAKTPKGVFELLDRLWKAALPNAKKEAAALQKLADREKPRVKRASWAWWYYAEQLRKQLMTSTRSNCARIFN